MKLGKECVLCKGIPKLKGVWNTGISINDKELVIGYSVCPECIGHSGLEKAIFRKGKKQLKKRFPPHTVKQIKEIVYGN